MRKKSFIILSIMLACAQFMINAQQGNRVVYNTIYFERDNDNVYVSINIRMTAFSVKPSETLILTPALQSGTSMHELPSIILNGTDKSVTSNENLSEDPFTVMNMADRKDITYQAKTVYAPWMSNAQLRIVKSLFDASNTPLYVLSDIVSTTLVPRSGNTVITAPQREEQVAAVQQATPISQQIQSQQAPVVTAADQFGLTTNQPIVSTSQNTNSYTSTPAYTQSSNTNAANNSARFERTGNDVFVSMQFRMTAFSAGPDEILVFTPIIEHSSQGIDLPRVVLTGVNREFKDDGGTTPYAIMSMANRRDVQYQTKVMYAPWMDNAQLRVVKSLYDANDAPLYALSDIVNNRLTQQYSSAPQPVIAQQEPKPVQQQVQQPAAIIQQNSQPIIVQQVKAEPTPAPQVQAQAVVQQTPVTAADQFGYNNTPQPSYSTATPVRTTTPTTVYTAPSSGNTAYANGRFEKKDNEVLVNMQVKMTGFYTEPNEMLVLTPTIQYGATAVELPRIVMTGTGRRYVSDGGEEPFSVLNMANRKDLVYNASVPYAPWMDNAQLKVVKSLYDASNTPLYAISDVISNSLSSYSGPYTQHIASVQQATPTQTTSWTPSTPQAVAPTYRLTTDNVAVADMGVKTFYLYFPTKNSSQVTDMPANTATLEEIRNTVNSILSSDRLSLVSINIAAGTSPEGLYGNNEQLTKKQALAFESYLKNRMGYSRQNIITDWLSEDWAGLTQLIEASNMQYKTEILDIIRSTPIFSGRENKIMALGQGEPYRYMQLNFFPQLCRIECRIVYQTK